MTFAGTDSRMFVGRRQGPGLWLSVCRTIGIVMYQFNRPWSRLLSCPVVHETSLTSIVFVSVRMNKDCHTLLHSVLLPAFCYEIKAQPHLYDIPWF